MQGTLSSIFSNDIGRIEWTKIFAISISTLGQEFTIHMPPDHDYRLKTTDSGNEYFR